MKNYLKIGICAAVLALTAGVQALPISGSIGFAGTYTQVGGTPGTLGSATSMTIDSVAILADDGHLNGSVLSSFVGSIGVNGNAPALPAANLWVVIAGGSTYTFNVTSVTESLNGTGPSQQLNLIGTGIVSDGAGPLDDTTGTFELGFGVSGTTFLFHSTSAVPDGGATAMLIGVGLLGLGALRRKS